MLCFNLYSYIYCVICIYNDKETEIILYIFFIICAYFFISIELIIYIHNYNYIFLNIYLHP